MGCKSSLMSSGVNGYTYMHLQQVVSMNCADKSTVYIMIQFSLLNKAMVKWVCDLAETLISYISLEMAIWVIVA